MSLDTDAVETILFDSYGTIVDVSAVQRALAEHVEDPASVSKIWRERSLLYAMVGNAIEEHRTFYEMNRRALQYALETSDVDLEERTREAILETYHELDVYDDVREGMERLREAGYDLYVLSNGTPEMLDSMVEHAEIGSPLEDTISAEEVGVFKPEAEIYEHGADRADTPVENVAFVSGGWWDVPGAIHAGMQGVWINRQDTIWGPYDLEPDLTIQRVHELADALGA